jgi:hypothetical protein
MHGILIRAELAGGALIDKDGTRLLVAARKVHSKLTQRRVVTLRRNSTATGAGLERVPTSLPHQTHCHQPRLLGSTSPRATTPMHRDCRPRRPGSTSACASISARSSNEFDYFDFARMIGSPPMTTSTTRLDLKTSWNRLRLVELHQQTIAAPSTSSTASSTFIHKSS